MCVCVPVCLVRLMRKLQAKPEYQRAVAYLLEKVRTVQEKGGLHAERMEQQLKGTHTHPTSFLQESAADC